MMPSLRLIFMGTPTFSVPTLQALLDSCHQVVAVYSQPPRPSGRGHQVQKSAIHELAEAHQIPIFTTSNLKNSQEQTIFAGHKADAAIVIAYGLVLPEAMLNIPRLGCLNVHASLLPRWRGAAPIQRAIEAGDQITGVTIMKMDKGLDTGPILLKKSISITEQMTTDILYETLSEGGAALLLEALELYASGTIKPIAQPDEGITYAPKLTREESQIDWRIPAKCIVRKIRAFTLWPGAWFEYEGTRLKVLQAEVLSYPPSVPGTILDNQLTIACSQDALRIKILQRPGGVAVDSQAFLRGYPMPAGTVLPCPAIN